MKKTLFTMLFGLGLFLISSAIQAAPTAKTAYDFSFKTLIGQKPMPLGQFSGRVIMVVNTASRCGFTQQYKGLEALYQKYKDQGLVIIGVPSNDFGNQEPGSAQEIARFCKMNFGVTFPLTAKETVSGDTAHPFYQWARQELGFGSAPKWNFHKYVINRQGQIIDFFHSTTTPDNPRLVNVIEAALKE